MAHEDNQMSQPDRIKAEAKRIVREVAEERAMLWYGHEIRVYRRGADGRAEPAELLPRVYGGRYNRQLRGYTDEPPEVVRDVEVPALKAV